MRDGVHLQALLPPYLELCAVKSVMDDDKPKVKGLAELHEVVCLLLGPGWLHQQLLDGERKRSVVYNVMW